jgi:hypothetical protein
MRTHICTVAAQNAFYRPFAGHIKDVNLGGTDIQTISTLITPGRIKLQMERAHFVKQRCQSPYRTQISAPEAVYKQKGD